MAGEVASVANNVATQSGQVVLTGATNYGNAIKRGDGYEAGRIVGRTATATALMLEGVPEGKAVSKVSTIFHGTEKQALKREAGTVATKAESGEAQQLTTIDTKTNIQVEQISNVGAKRGPKTDPNAPHNKKIRETADGITDGEVIAGGGRLPEKAIPTPGGIKDSRRPDILVRNPDGSIRAINVGKTKTDGTPIKREAQAITDLEQTDIKTEFVPLDQ